MRDTSESSLSPSDVTEGSWKDAEIHLPSGWKCNSHRSHFHPPIIVIVLFDLSDTVSCLLITTGVCVYWTLLISAQGTAILKTSSPVHSALLTWLFILSGLRCFYVCINSLYCTLWFHHWVRKNICCFPQYHTGLTNEHQSSSERRGWERNRSIGRCHRCYRSRC